jgi:3-hydroxyacyl-CoA dehydrogenase
MPPEVVEELNRIMTERFGRQVITCADMPAFAGNRIGFKVLNEVAQLAERHGAQLMDTIVGPYTGRAMAPLATVDLVGWDVHQAIVDNVLDNVQDEAIDAFRLPNYMKSLIGRGHLGDKTPMLGGFYRRVSEDGKTTVEVLDPTTGRYKPLDRSLRVPFVEEVKDLHHRGRYQEGVHRFMEAEGFEAETARGVILGYVSYALHRVGEDQVVASYADVDRIMTAGFNWAPPSAIADLIGIPETIAAMERHGLSVPPLLRAAARGEVPTPLFNLPFVTPGRYFAG